jgi:hypothetical protein
MKPAKVLNFDGDVEIVSRLQQNIFTFCLLIFR